MTTTQKEQERRAKEAAEAERRAVEARRKAQEDLRRHGTAVWGTRPR
ncbi:MULTISPECIES: hypothetical protein [Streptomyces]|nr:MULTISPECIES: hypothetical protein [Streptomyces]EIF87931.1 hypothetical protein [Streptomyces tsukubensis NRRL18488]MYS65144.1 hypothetical protein [Streptomyces sp. SID5473]